MKRATCSAFPTCIAIEGLQPIRSSVPGAEVAERYNIPAYTTLPFDPKFARLCDEGKVEDYDVEGKLDVIIDKIVEAGEKQDGEAAE